MNEFKTDVLRWCLLYIALGWAVFRLYTVDEEGRCTCGDLACTDIGKHPFKGTRGFKDATTDEATVRSWFDADEPPFNPAIATGEISNLTIADIDVGPGKLGWESWQAAIEGHGEPNTLTARTGGGGYHVGFLFNSALKTGNNRLGTHIDVKNDGGYVVAAPSRHKSGGVYEWLNWGTALCALPAHLSTRKETRGRPKKDATDRPYTLDEVEDMLTYVSADDRDIWRAVGIILGRLFPGSEAAYAVYEKWAAKWDGQKGRGHDEEMYKCFHITSQEATDRELTIGTLIHEAKKHGWVPKGGSIPLEQFVYDHEGNNFIYRPNGKSWLAPSVDVACTAVNDQGTILKPHVWIQQHATITSTTRDPAIHGDVLKGFDCRDGALFATPGGAVFNRYRPPEIELGDATLAGQFLDHVHAVFHQPGDADQFLNYMAHRRQRPGEKPQFALVIGGDPGVGKDTAVQLCAPALGVWNVAIIPPVALDHGFNEYAARVLVRISEVASQQDMSKWTFYERAKDLITGSDEYLTINPKYGRQYAVRLHCGVIITTNHLTDGLYVPAEDRRYDLIEAATLEEMKLEDEKTRAEYFLKLYDWARAGGRRHIAAYLQERDLSGFRWTINRKTEAWRRIVQHGLSGYEWCTDLLDKLTNTNMVSGAVLLDLAMRVPGTRHEEIRRSLGYAMKGLGYVVHANPGVKDGRWKLDLDRNRLPDKDSRNPPVWHKIYRKKDFHPEPGLEWQKTLDEMKV